MISKNIQNIRRLILTSNGSKPVYYYKELFSILSKDYPFFFYLSIHPEYISSIDKLKEKLIGLSSISKNFQPAILFKKTSNVFHIINAVDQLYDLGYLKSPKIVFVRGGMYNEKLLENEYTLDDIQMCIDLNKKWYDLIWESRGSFWMPHNIKNLEHNYALNSGFLDFSNMYCCHGATTLWIHNNGFCSGSICKNAKISKFSIYDGVNPYLVKDYLSIIRCSSKLCGCKDNLLIPKFYYKKEAKNYLKTLSFI